MFEFMRMLVGAEARPEASVVLPKKIDEVAPRNRTGMLVKSLIYRLEEGTPLVPGDIGCITGILN